MNTSRALFVTAAAWLAAAGVAAAQPAEIRIGIIGTDTSHVTAFTRLLNDRADPNHVAGARVVAAFRGGSPEIEASRTRIDRFAAELTTQWGVEFVDSIEALCARVERCCWRASTGARISNRCARCSRRRSACSSTSR